jgi:crotonobetainyl-CoA:carnitine CoA-transferase CaiB-like acyl-CoA transferase
MRPGTSEAIIGKVFLMMKRSSTESTLPLDGVRVIELTDGKSDSCGRLLADLGADVVRVEERAGSPARALEPMHDGISVAFAVRNANKRSVALDPGRAEDLSQLKRLVLAADIFIETTRPGTLGRIGLGADALLAENPRLVIVSLTDFGQTGPYRDYVATPPVHAAMAAVLCRSGAAGREPLLPPADIPVEAAAAEVAWAALLGFWNAEVTGAGDHIDISLFEATGHVMDPAVGMTGTALSATPQREAWTSRGRPSGRPYPIHRCVDGHVRIVLLSERQWQQMGHWLGDPADYPRYGNTATRAGIVEVIIPMIDDLVRNRTMEELVAEGQRRGIPIAPVLDPGQVLLSEHYRTRNAIKEVEIASGAWAAVPNGTVDIGGERAGIRRRAPWIGEHNDEVAGEWLRRRRDDSEALSVPDFTSRRPLSGVRVLDLGVIVYGAELGRLFADQGADVIKVESRAYPDGARVSHGTDMNPNFAAGNRGKQSIGVNLRCAAGVDIIRRLVAQSDIVLANFKPGTLEFFGLGYEALREANPSVVFVQSSAMGSTGPWRNWVGYGPVVRCAAGLTNLWRYSEDDEFFGDATTIFPDNFCARVMATAGLASLVKARRTGLGTHVDGAQAESILAVLSTPLAAESLKTGSAFAAANRNGAGSPWGIFPCSGDDEWCVITIRDDDDWRRLCTVLRDNGFEDEFGFDPKYAQVPCRMADAARIAEWLSAWTARTAPDEVESFLQNAGVPAGKMRRVLEFVEDPHLRAREYLDELQQPEMAPVVVEGAPFKSRRIPAPRMVPAPVLGQHTREVVSELLCLPDDEISLLVETGVLDEAATYVNP